MKIDQNKKDLRHFRAIEKKDIPQVKRGLESSFENELTYHREISEQLKMQELLDKIDNLGKRLNRSINIKDLMAYKKMVKDFLKEASSRAYRLKQERGRHRRGRTMLLTIDIIDEEIEQLIKEFMSSKKEPLDILETLDKIRGMLVDLMI